MNHSNVVIDAENHATLVSNNIVNAMSSNIPEIIKLKKTLAKYKEKLNKEHLVNTRINNIHKECYIDAIIDCYKYIHNNYEKTSLFFPSYEHFKKIFGNDALDFPKDPEFKKACLHVFSNYKSINITNMSLLLSATKLCNIYTLINKLIYLVNATSDNNSAQENNLNNNIYYKAKSISKNIKNTIDNYNENITALKKFNALLLDDVITLQGRKFADYAKELPAIIANNRHQISKSTYDKINDHMLTIKISETSFKEVKILLEPERKSIRDNLYFLESYKKHFENLHRDIIHAFNKKYGISIDKNKNVVENYLSPAIYSLEKYHSRKSKHRRIAAIISLGHLFISQKGNAIDAIRANIAEDKFDNLLPIIEATFEIINSDLSIVSIDNKTITTIIKLIEQKISALQLAQSSIPSIFSLINQLNNNINAIKNLYYKDADILKKNSIDLVLNIYNKNNKNFDITQQSILNKLTLYFNNTKFLQLIFKVLSSYSSAPNETIKQIILQKDEYHNLKNVLRKAYLNNSKDDIANLNMELFELTKKYPYGELQSDEISNDLEEIRQQFDCEDSRSFSLSPKEPYSVYLDEDDQISSINNASTSPVTTESSLSVKDMTENLQPLTFTHKSIPIQISHTKDKKKHKEINLPPLSANFLKADTPFRTDSTRMESKGGFNLDDDDDDYQRNHEILRNSSKLNFNL